MRFNEICHRLIAQRNIDLTVDVGANAGQFAKVLRQEYRYLGKVISFEPLTDPYANLAEAARGDRSWICLNMALGDVEEPALINISANSWSSSMLDVVPRSLERETSVGYTGQQNVSFRRLDDFIPESSPDSQSIFLKLDVQGFEGQVLLGSDDRRFQFTISPVTI
jgi:FkbM family methyltransferase